MGGEMSEKPEAGSKARKAKRAETAPAKPAKLLRPPVNGWECLQNVLLKLIDTAQLHTILFMVVVLIIVSRMSPETCDSLARELFAKVSQGENWTAPSFVAALAGWGLHVKVMRGQMKAETKRLGLEKSELQRRLMKGNISSSDEVD